MLIECQPAIRKSTNEPLIAVEPKASIGCLTNLKNIQRPAGCRQRNFQMLRFQFELAILFFQLVKVVARIPEIPCAIFEQRSASHVHLLGVEKRPVADSLIGLTRSAGAETVKSGRGGDPVSAIARFVN